MSRSRTILSRLLLTFAALLAIAALLAGWVRGQLLDPQRYVETSAEVLAEPTVQQATASYLAEQLTRSAIADARISEGIAPSVRNRARVAASERLRDRAERAAVRVLSSSSFQRLWREANAASYRQLRRAVEDDRRGALVLDLRPLLGSLALQLGLDGRPVANLPERDGVVRILSAEEVDQVRGAANALRLAARGLALFTFLAVLAGVAVAPSRMVGVRDAGAALLFAGGAVLVVRQFVGGTAIDAFVTDVSIRPAGQQAWWIVTGHLRDLARGTAGLGALLLLGGALVHRRAPVAPR